MPADQNKEIVRRFIEEALGRGNLSVVNEYLSPDFVDHSAPPGLPPGRDSVTIQFTKMRVTFPDLQVDIHDLFAEGDKVIVCKTMRGTHRAEFFGVPATGKMISFETINTLRLVDGKIVEHWNMLDYPGLMQQLKPSMAVTPG